ncbi:MAG TPA: hypothetical protein VMR45_02100 [Patescibacteria group bacterium]|nr:hypothetical protein [Patescibacteria group bacterium]
MFREQSGIDIVGSSRHDIQQDELGEAIDMQRAEFDHGNEISKTAEERAVILAMHDAVVATAARLGVDVRDRLPRIEDYHIYENIDEFATVARRADPGMAEGLESSGAIAHPIAGILWCRENFRDLDKLRSFAAHETWHWVSRQRIHFTKHVLEDGSVAFTPSSKSGYGSISFSVNEMFTEAATLDVLHTGGHPIHWVGHHGLGIISEELTVKIAEKTGKPAIEVHDKLVKGTLNGDMSGLRQARQVLDTQQMRRFIALGTKQDNASTISAAEAMGLPEAARRLTVFYDDYEKTGERHKSELGRLRQWVGPGSDNVATKPDGEALTAREIVAAMPGASVGQLGRDVIRIINLLEVPKDIGLEADNAIFAFASEVRTLMGDSARNHGLGIGDVAVRLGRAIDSINKARADLDRYVYEIGYKQ